MQNKESNLLAQIVNCTKNTFLDEKLMLAFFLQSSGLFMLTQLGGLQRGLF